MNFAWVEYLELADALLANRETFANEEACCRASISRAYYAVFCAARNHAAVNEGLQLSRTGTIIGEFIDTSSKGQVEIIGPLGNGYLFSVVAATTQTTMTTCPKSSGTLSSPSYMRGRQ